jgi:hypothetical protein
VETGIQQNPEESGGIRGKYRNSCPAGIPAKNSCDSGKNQEFLQPPPKPCSCEKIIRKTQGKKGILRNPGRNGFFGPKNKFLKTGICNLGGDRDGGGVGLGEGKGKGSGGGGGSLSCLAAYAG